MLTIDLKTARRFILGASKLDAQAIHEPLLRFEVQRLAG